MNKNFDTVLTNNEGEKIKISSSKLMNFASEGINAQIRKAESTIRKGQKILNREISCKKTNAEVIDIIRDNREKIEKLINLKGSLSFYIENCYEDIEFIK
ncbi:hypothetical protein [uncultured Clostridium sp.]|uniref:hypothetical protein n=1 Tax=uncultured Clostridium sp. TaxID=59620 RepID=UPI0027DE5401|nr:hypothetical protein [uncultured Clostridium sp.]